MKYSLSMDVEINDQDVEVIELVPYAIQNRFNGTPVVVSNIQVTEKEAV